MFNNTDSRKISHREVFLEGTYRLSVKGAFLLQKPPLFQSKSWIKKFTRKGAFTDKVFRTLRSATKGSAFRIRHLLKKVDENFCFCCNERVPCAEIAISHKTKARNSVQLQVGSALSMEPNFTLAQKSECVTTSERRVLKLSPYTKPKRDIGSSFKLAFLLTKNGQRKENLPYRTNQR